MDQEMLDAAQALLELCARKRLTLGLAESCTGGLLGATLTAIPGSSHVLDRGFITYSNDAKQQIGVAAATIERYGAVSRETAEAMAKGVLANAPGDAFGCHHRHRRTGRRHAGEAGGAGAFCCRRVAQR
jgi:nicotinamide-nucleotide amidase